MGAATPTLPCKIWHPALRSPVIVQWIAPQEGPFKINVDGSSLSLRQAGSGWILRDSIGALILVWANSYGLASNIVVETQGLLDGIHHCYYSGFCDIYVESNLKILRKVTTGSLHVPWMIDSFVREICSLMSQGNILLMHIHREYGKVEDKCKRLVTDSDQAKTLAITANTKIGDALRSYPSPRAKQSLDLCND
ncbi:hypothetical protein ACH5RR_037151 [Cinchona calisaya]|uniref:RNase H type-1 domain-containing protein n=1 Tax=Cinchona calisaya TaxID=153742 RepID=A0ABD2Y8F0_9GENT